jgi:hypothetical protein
MNTHSSQLVFLCDVCRCEERDRDRSYSPGMWDDPFDREPCQCGTIYRLQRMTIELIEDKIYVCTIERDVVFDSTEYDDSTAPRGVDGTEHVFRNPQDLDDVVRFTTRVIQFNFIDSEDATDIEVFAPYIEYVESQPYESESEWSKLRSEIRTTISMKGKNINENKILHNDPAKRLVMIEEHFANRIKTLRNNFGKKDRISVILTNVMYQHYVASLFPRELKECTHMGRR